MRKTLKAALEDIITTDAFQPGNLVGTRTPDGGTASPSRGPQKARGKLRLRKKAKVNSLGTTRRPTMFRIQPAQWETGEDPNGGSKSGIL